MTPAAPHDPEKILASLSAWWESSGVDIAPIASPPRAKGKTASGAANTKRKPLPPIEPAKAKTSLPAPTPSEGYAELFAKAKAMAGAAPTLEALRAAVESFDAGDLSANASRAVFARGNPQADVMVIGEAPGREEDKHGQPYIGPEGALLDKMLGAIGLDETSAYITTLSNWRTLTRTLGPNELSLCAPIIARHIELAAPKIIILLGGAPLEALCAVRGIMKSRGQWQTIASVGKDIPAMPLYNPQLLLKNPELKRDAWRDLLAVKSKLKL